MKKLIPLFIFITSFLISFAQAPQTFKYQAVVRDNSGNVLTNMIISIRTSVLKGNISGNIEYSEVHTISTNEFGVINLNIGLGTVQNGNFSSINWGSDIYFIKTEVDLNGGNNFTFMGTSQLLAVPYALYAAKAGNSATDNDTSATNEIQTLNVNGNNLNISNGNNVPIDADPSNEIQNLNLNGTTLNITQGNSVNIDVDPNNEIQTLNLNGNNLSISQGNLVPIDANPTNEIQALSLSNDTLYLSNGGQVWIGRYFQNLSLNGNQLEISNGNSITLGGTVDLDADPTNELQVLKRSNDTLYLSKGNFALLPKEIDADTTNELQGLSIIGNNISISKGNGITLPPNHDNDSLNEIQALQLTGGTLTLTKANSVNLPDNSSTNELQQLSFSNDTLSLNKNGGNFFLGKYFDMPTGSIIPYAGKNIPNGYLFCDGSAISRTQYNNLFVALGVSWGSGDGTMTFNLPDLRGNFLRGVDSTANYDIDRNLRTAKYTGGNTGNKVGTYQEDQFKSHTHSYNMPLSGGGGGSQSIGIGGAIVTTAPSGGSETRPMNAYVYFIIRY